MYSATHVVESLPTEPQENSDAVQRLEIITRPEARSVVGWGRLAQIERSDGGCDLHSLFCSRDEMLFPDFSVKRADWNKKIRARLKEKLEAQIPDQNYRRSVQAKLLKQGKLTPAAFRFFRETATENAQMASSEMPEALPMFGANGIYDFLEGKISEAAFAKKFLETLANPSALASLSMNPDLSSILDISRFFWTYMEWLKRLLTKLIDDLRLQVQVGGADYKKVRIDSVEFLKSEAFRLSIAYHFSGVKVSSEELNRMPGIRLYVDVFSQYVLENLDKYARIDGGKFGSVPEFDRGDAADLSHVVYLPYVDYFGCDGRMRERIKRAGRPTKNIFVNDQALEGILAEIGGCA